MAFHFLDKDMMKKIITTMIIPKQTGIHKSNLVFEAFVKIGRKAYKKQQLTYYDERLKQMHLTTQKGKRKRRLNYNI